MAKIEAKILVVDDDIDVLNTARMYLKQQFTLVQIENNPELIPLHFERESFDVVLLDLSLPDSHGLNTLERVHAHAPEVPIVVMTGFDNEMLGVKAVKEGAQDYLVKGQVDSYLLMHAIRYAIERKQIELRLVQLAQYDSLTGLANRALFQDRLPQALARADRAGQLVGLMFLDLDRFKEINDTLGHDAGDVLLKSVAERLEGRLRRTDTIARLGGDDGDGAAVIEHV